MNERHITTPYPYLSLKDLDSVVRRVAPDIERDKTAALEENLIAIEHRYAPHEATFYECDAGELTAMLDGRVLEELTRTDRHVGVVNLDKEIAKTIEDPRLFKVNISRAGDGTLAARIGTTEPPDVQLQNMADWVRRGQFEEVLLVDDVLAFGDTVPVLVKEIRLSLPDMPLRFLAGIAASGGGWQGIQKVEAVGINPEYFIRVEASDEIDNGSAGMAVPTSRDFTLLGGKVGVGPNSEPTALPYMLPFSAPVRSFVREGEDAAFSYDILAFNDELFEIAGTVNRRDVTIRDMAALGFGIPFTNLQKYRETLGMPELDTPVRAFVAHATSIIAESD